LRTGLRGSHPGSFEVAHALRDGQAVGQALAGPAHESYDLVVVGGGISGLSAALFYRDRNPGARILILENHDDFGGHAKRNEFRVRGHTLLMNGGTAGIESPTPYSKVADGLLKRLGIDVPALTKAYGGAEADEGAIGGVKLGRAVFFDRESFGTDALIPLPDDAPLGEALAKAPLSPAARADRRAGSGRNRSARRHAHGRAQGLPFHDQLSRLPDEARRPLGRGHAVLSEPPARLVVRGGRRHLRARCLGHRVLPRIQGAEAGAGRHHAHGLYPARLCQHRRQL
jgi:hypothetical protein